MAERLAPESLPRRTWLRAACVGIVVVCVGAALASCRSEQVRDLAADAVTSTVPTGGDLVISDEENERGPGLLGKPSPAQVRKAYAFASPQAAQRGLSELRDAAEASGWELEPRPPGAGGFSAVRDLDGRQAMLTVTLNVDPAFPPAPGVFVSVRSRD